MKHLQINLISFIGRVDLLDRIAASKNALNELIILSFDPISNFDQLSLFSLNSEDATYSYLPLRQRSSLIEADSPHPRSLDSLL